MKASKDTVKKIKKLVEIANELKKGNWFSITRLTSLKTLCVEPEVSASFAIAIVGLVSQRIQSVPCPDIVSISEWEDQCQLIQLVAGDLKLSQHSEEPFEKRFAHQRIFDRLKQVQAINNEYRIIRSSQVRIIRNHWVLVVEDALHCLLHPGVGSHWAYQIARDYVEKYSPRYGTGLIPESEPLLQDVITFFVEFYQLSNLVSSSENELLMN